MGVRIFMLSLRQVWLNRSVAIRISLFWYGLIIAMSLVIAFAGSPVTAPVLGLMFLLVTVFALSMVAIGWHRYVLREEEPRGLVSIDRSWPVSSYIWTLLKLALVILLPLIALSIPFAAAAGGSGGGAMGLFAFLAGGIATWLILRMGLVLPAIAVGDQLTLRDSFALTRPVAVPLLVTTALMILMQSIPNLLSAPANLLDHTSHLRYALLLALLPVNFIIGWINAMVGVGVLTVLYGHLYENRPL